MPKLPRISGKELGGVVPNHREIKVGTLTGILKQAEVSADEFMDALHF
jgi:hypothetical protein